MMASSTRNSVEQPRVFISYARSDGEEIANVLRARLEAAHIPLWQDRVKMEGGHDWWLQITDALDHVEFMVLIITPAALKSLIVRKEWRYARQQGVCVYPVKAHPDIDFKSLPRWMRDVHWYDLDYEWPKFLNDLNHTCEQPHVPFMVEDLPTDFVPRPTEFNALISKLLDEKREEPIAITAALRGAGGYGKTTIARAICHDERIQEAFDDGILWITLGENPAPDKLIGLIADLIYMLSHERPSFTGLDTATARLSELLSDHDILLVIDDVWNAASLKPFLQGGKRCARLITTRDERVVPSGAPRIHVDSMQQGEAIRLLIQGIDDSTYSATKADALHKLVKRLGEWPLLLKLVNSILRARIETHQSLSDALAFVNEALDEGGLAIFDEEDAQDRNHAVATTLEVSLKLLNADEKARYHDLVVFPEDIDIPLDTLQKLWALGKIKTELLCERLFKLSLLLNFDPVKRTVRLHDIVRAYLRQGVGTQLASYDRKLLDSYALKRWADLPPDEPYMWDYLAIHLIGAGRIEELVVALKDGQYLATKMHVRPVHAVEADLILGQKQVPADKELRLLARNIARISHLLARCKTFQEVVGVLYSRLSLLPDLSYVCGALEQNLRRPFLTPWHSLPDLSQVALMRTLVGHENYVRECVVSPSGEWVVSASDDKILKIWDAHTGEERLTLKGHEDWVRGCAVSPSGEWIVSASSDKTLKVWNAHTGEERLTLKGHRGEVNGCTVSPSGEWIVSASSDKTLKVWNAHTGEERLTLRGHDGGVNGCAVSPTGEWIISASEDKTLKTWNAHTGKERLTLKGHEDWVRGCAISPTGDWIVSASDDKTLRVWNAHTGKQRLTLKGHEDWVRGCAISPTGDWIVSCAYDKTLKVWDAHTGEERLTLRGHDGGVNGCAVSPTGEWIVSASSDETLKIWDVQTGEERLELKGHDGEVNGCAVSPTREWVVSASSDKTLKVWDAHTGEERLTLKGHDGGVNGCAVSPSGEWVVSCSYDKTLKVWDIQTGEEVRTLKGHRDWVRGCTVSPSGEWIVSASDDRTLRVWDIQNKIYPFSSINDLFEAFFANSNKGSNEPKKASDAKKTEPPPEIPSGKLSEKLSEGKNRLTLRKHWGRVNGCAVSPSGEWIVSCSYDTTLKVWNVQTGEEVRTLKGHRDWIRGCAVSPSGDWIVSASSDKTLKVWDTQTGEERLTLEGHDSEVNGCAVSPSGEWIISTSNDKTLKVWDAHTGDCLTTLIVDDELNACIFCPDGQHIVAGGDRGVYFLRLVSHLSLV